MKLRVARHTEDLKKIIHFYVDLIGLKNLGSFTDHDGYDGVFIGMDGCDWHLEFTANNKEPLHHADEDDMLVLYCKSVLKKNTILARLSDAGIEHITAKNPYWTQNGVCFLDPDGFRIMISLE